MRTPEIIDRRLVHKHNPENVLLADLRLAVPSRLDPRALAEVERRDGAAADDLREHYVPHGECLVLAGLEPILRLPPDELRDRLSALPAEESAELLASYDRDGDELLLRPDVDERGYERLLIALGAGHAVLPTCEKLRISRALELLADPPRAYCATLVVDTAHDFFFDHLLDHVPGLMIMEAARQMGVAVEFKFRGMEVESQIALQAVAAEFQGYVDHCIPAELFCRETGRGEPRPGRPACDVHLEITVHQLGRQAARFTLVGDAISPTLLERLRRNRTATLAHRIFVPRSHVAPTVVVGGENADADAARAIPTALWLDGMRLRVAHPSSMGDGERDFTMSFPELPAIAGRFRVIRQWREAAGSFAEVEIVAFDKSSRYTLHKAMALYCVWSGEERRPSFPASDARAPAAVVVAG